MSRTIGVSLTDDEKINLAKMLECDEVEISKVLKATFTNQVHSKFYRKFFREPPEEQQPNSPASKAHQMSDKELRDTLGIKGTNLIKKIREKGLHYQKNLELYLTQFLQEWNGDPYKARELILTVREYTDKEFLVKELVNRYI